MGIQESYDNLSTKVTSYIATINTKTPIIDNAVSTTKVTNITNLSNLVAATSDQLTIEEDAKLAKIYADKTSKELSHLEDLVAYTASDKPSISPSLNLQFDKDLELSPEFVFNRATTAKYFNGETVVAEENLIPNSTQLGGSGLLTITRDNVIAPDGTLTADTWTAAAAANQYTMVYSTMAYYKTHTFSMWAKVPSGTVDLKIGDNGGHVFATWTVTDQWQRFSVTYTTFNNGYLKPVCAVDTGAEFHVWGGQLELRDFLTPYTPTTGKPIIAFIPKLVDASINEPRIEVEPITNVCKGLLMEKTKTNVLTYSNDFTQWFSGEVTVVPSSKVGFDGALSVSKIVPSTALTNHHVRSPYINSSYRNFSIFAKAGEYEGMILQSSSGVGMGFNLTTGTFTGGDSHPYKVTPLGNGWHRYDITMPDFYTGYVYIHASDLSSPAYPVNFSGDGESGIYIWGAQCEIDELATSYIETTGSEGTRASDVLNIATEDTWFNGEEGSLFVEVGSRDDGRNTGIISLDDASSGYNQMSIQHSLSPKSYFVVKANGGSWQVSNEQSIWNDDFRKIALSYSTNNVTWVEKGGTVLKDYSAIIPYTTRLQVGKFATSDGFTIGLAHFKQIKYYPKQLTDIELKLLTKA